MVEKRNNSYIFTNNTETELEKFVGIEAYLAPKCIGTSGVYKHSPKDFIVKEITKDGQVLSIKENLTSLDFSDEMKDRYTTFNLVKVNKDTFDAIKEISRALHISPNHIHYSGLKDKCSISVQKLSIKGSHVEALKKLKINEIFIKNITPTKKPVVMGSNRGNKFTITIRNIEKAPRIEKKIDDVLKLLKEKGFLNYYGLQRFGTYRPNSHLIGRYMLEGNYRKAVEEFLSTIYSSESLHIQSIRKLLGDDGDLQTAYDTFPKSMDYERKIIKHLLNNKGDYEGAIYTLPESLIKLILSSFQSFLFNKILTRRIIKGYSIFKPEKGDVITILDEVEGLITQIRYKYGSYYDEFLEKALKLNRAAIIIPLIGYETNLNDFPLVKRLLDEILIEEGIDEEIFGSELYYKYEFKGSFRPILAKPIGLSIKAFTEDEIFPNKLKLIIDFSLNRGSYATMLLRELLK